MYQLCTQSAHKSVILYMYDLKFQQLYEISTCMRKIKLRFWFFSFMHTIGANGIVISPSTDYTTFENNPSTFTFNCSGSGTNLYWTVDGYNVTTPYVCNKGIYYAVPVSPDGVTVSSQLIVPTTKANNNTVVMCTVLDASFNHQSSDPVRLILQGTVLNLMST